MSRLCVSLLVFAGTDCDFSGQVVDVALGSGATYGGLGTDADVTCVRPAPARSQRAGPPAVDLRDHPECFNRPSQLG